MQLRLVSTYRCILHAHVHRVDFLNWNSPQARRPILVIGLMRARRTCRSANYLMCYRTRAVYRLSFLTVLSLSSTKYTIRLPDVSVAATTPNSALPAPVLATTGVG